MRLVVRRPRWTQTARREIAAAFFEAPHFCLVTTPTMKNFPTTKLNWYWRLLKETSVDWWEDNTFRMAAAIAFYTIFSLAPVLIIAETVGSLLLDEVNFSVRNDLANELGTLVGEEGGQVVEQVLESASRTVHTSEAIAASLIALLVGSTFVFLELQTGLNEIWGVKSKPRASVFQKFFMARLRSFGIALMVGMLLVVSLVLSTLLQIFQRQLSAKLAAETWLWNSFNMISWFLLVTVLFAMIYKFLPDVKLPWKNVVVGALVTSLLFSLGKSLIAVYLGHASVGSSYGAAGSFVVFLVWVFYSSLICFYGAEFTHVYTRLCGERLRTEEYATPVNDEKGRELADVDEEKRALST